MKKCLDCPADISHLGYRNKRCPACAKARRSAKQEQTNKSQNPKVTRAANPETHKAATKRWRENNKEHFTQVVSIWKDANKEHLAEYRKSQYQKTKVRENALARQWKKNNPEASLGLSMKRAAAKLQAIPFWFDAEKVDKIYAEARKITAESGISHSVDHIMPLQSQIVCGLHVHTNLRVVTRAENQSKKNKFLPELAAAAIEQIIATTKAFILTL